MEKIYIQLGSVLFYKDRRVQNMYQVNLGCNVYLLDSSS